MSIVGSASSAALRSDATRTARRRGEVAGIEPAMRSLVQMKSAPWATSMRARNAMRPTAMRQKRLRYQLTDNARPESDIRRLVPCAPYCEDHDRIGRVALDLLSQTLDQRVH